MVLCFDVCPLFVEDDHSMFSILYQTHKWDHHFQAHKSLLAYIVGISILVKQDFWIMNDGLFLLLPLLFTISCPSWWLPSFPSPPLPSCLVHFGLGCVWYMRKKIAQIHEWIWDKNRYPKRNMDLPFELKLCPQFRDDWKEFP